MTRDLIKICYFDRIMCYNSSNLYKNIRNKRIIPLHFHKKLQKALSHTEYLCNFALADENQIKYTD